MSNDSSPHISETSLAPSAADLSAEKTEYLKYLSIGYYILAGFAFLCGFFPVLHFVFGLAMVGGFVSGAGLGGPEAIFGCFFVLIALFITVSAWFFAYFAFITGRSLVARQRHTLCLVMAGVSCLFAPLGTLVGVFTIILLVDPEVKRAFGIEARPTHLSPPPSP